MAIYDVVIIGSGLAALTVAAQLSEHKHVIILTKSKMTNSNSMLAQGGVAAAISKEDHWRKHYKDTMNAGWNSNDESAVQQLVKEGPLYIKKLIQEGMKFDSNHDGTLKLGLEGAHSVRRILHAGGDATGRSLVNFMLECISDRVTIIEDEMAVDLIVHEDRCIGVITKNSHEQLNTYFSQATILATGGCGGLFSFTSNDTTVTGDGIALAYRAGAELIDLEFIQFHPTLLYVNEKAVGLVSEAVRGEGAVLVDNSGRRIMEGLHPKKDLAPRDIVARAIYREIKQGKKIYLNIENVTDFNKRFPSITELCGKYGIPLENQLIPIVPGAHFLMGGVKTNLVGATSVMGLYAIGETACTRVHGANRLASNSLLEAIVFANRLAHYLLSKKKEKRIIPQNIYQPAVFHFPLPKHEEIQNIMMRYVGIERSYEGLLKAKRWFEHYNIYDLMQVPGMMMTKEQTNIVNMMITGWLITTSALQRTESRGAHYRTDYPIMNPKWQNWVIVRHQCERVFQQI
jgi:L-aspartate oxidase